MDWIDRIYSAARWFLYDLEALRQEILSQRELQKIAQSQTSESSFRPISSFHTDPRYGGDLHRGDMAWALHRGSFDSVAQLKRAISRFVEPWNQDAQPLVWTKTARRIRRCRCATSKRRRDQRGVWANRLRLKRGSYIAAVAIANKNARVMWALLTRGETYRAEPARRSSSTLTVKNDHLQRKPRRA